MVQTQLHCFRTSVCTLWRNDTEQQGAKPIHENKNYNEKYFSVANHLQEKMHYMVEMHKKRY